MAHAPSTPHSRRMAASYRARLVGHADRMRGEPTRAEELLWARLKGSQLGVVFRRQVVLGAAHGKLCVADFYAPAARLVVEVDGASHKHREAADERRDRALERLGCRVLRVSKACVERNLEEAVRLVRQALRARFSATN